MFVYLFSGQIIQTCTAQHFISPVYIQQPTMKLYKYYAFQQPPICTCSMVLMQKHDKQCLTLWLTFLQEHGIYLYQKNWASWIFEGQMWHLMAEKHEIIHMYSLLLLFAKYLCLPPVLKGTGPDSRGLWQPIVCREKQFLHSCFVALFLKCSVQFGECLDAFLKAWCFEYCFFGPSSFWFGFMLAISDNVSNRPSHFSRYRKRAKMWNNSSFSFRHSVSVF